MAGSFALPLHIWKKQIILITKKIISITANAIGTISVQNKINVQISIRISTTVNLRA